MQYREVMDMFACSPIVAAVKSDELLQLAVQSDCSVVFVLYGTILNIEEIVSTIKKSGKTAIVHTDLIGGLAAKDSVGVDFIYDHTPADGIISTKQVMVSRAAELGMIAGGRTFMVDSLAYESIRQRMRSFKPDFLEVMPGLLGPLMGEMSREFNLPVVAGGLLRSRDDILFALDQGACAISTTKSELWAL